MISGILFLLIAILWLFIGILILYTTKFVDNLVDNYGLWIAGAFWFLWNVPTCFLLAFGLTYIFEGIK